MLIIVSDLLLQDAACHHILITLSVLASLNPVNDRNMTRFDGVFYGVMANTSGTNKYPKVCTCSTLPSAQ